MPYEEKTEQAFLSYYNSDRFLTELRLPDKPGLHHFRFQYFAKGRLFRRVYDIVDSKSKLRTIIQKRCPKNVYFTPVKWLDPINVNRHKDKEINDYMLSSPLFFDIDRQLLNSPTIDSALEMTEILIGYIKKEYSRVPDWIVFSGKNGFHVYYWNWDNIVRDYCSPEDRILAFKKARFKILSELKNLSIRVDASVTMDPWRVLRVPGTLHGDSGLIAKALTSLTDFSFERTQPTVMSI